MPEVLERFTVDCEHLPPSAWRQSAARSEAWREPAASYAGSERHERAGHCPRDVGDGLSPELGHVRDAIERSRTILDLEDDWDDEGAQAYSEEVWERAVEFVRTSATRVRDRFGRVIDAPAILPGPDGSIDLHWNYPSYELLINIPADPVQMAGFYGDDRGQVTIKGTFPRTAPNEGVFLWLANTP